MPGPDLAGPPVGRRRPEADATRAPLDRRDAGAFVQDGAPLARDPGKSAGELRRIEHHAAVRMPGTGRPARGMDLGSGGLAVEEDGAFAEGGRELDVLAELDDLPRVIGQGQLTGLLEVARDRVGACEVDDRAKVLHPLAMEDAHLVGVVAQSVLEPVGEARLAEAAVSPGCPEPDPCHLEDRDAERGIGLEEAQGRPQAREPGPHDRDIGGRGAREGRGGRREVPAREPVTHGVRRVDGLHHWIVPDARPG